MDERPVNHNLEVSTFLGLCDSLNPDFQRNFQTESFTGHMPLALQNLYPIARNVPSDEERGETDVFAGYIMLSILWNLQKQSYPLFDKYNFRDHNAVTFFYTFTS